MIHLAAHEVHSPRCIRQRCAWCGAILLELDIAGTEAALPPGESLTFRFWPPGYFVEHLEGEGFDSLRVIESYRQGWRVPPQESCLALDPAVTR